MSFVRRQAGFSLVEVMVAMFILALAGALVVMSIPHREGGVDVEVRRFEDVLDRVSANAIVSGQTHAVHVEPDGYRIYRRVADRWVEAGKMRVVLPGSVRIGISSGREAAGDDAPQIIADPVGRIYGPDLRFTTGAQTRAVRSLAPYRDRLND